MERALLLDLLGAVYWFVDALQENMVARGFPRYTRAISFILLNIAQGERRATKISKNLGISRQAVSLMLISLRDKGVLDVREDPDDKRSQIVDFAPQFAEQGAACAEILSMLESEIGKRVGTQNLNAMRLGLATDWGPLPSLPKPQVRASKKLPNKAKKSPGRTRAKDSRSISGAMV